MAHWTFKPNAKGRVVKMYEDFANSSYASDVFNAMERTVIGSKILDALTVDKAVGFSVERMHDCYGQYIPRKFNLTNNDRYKDVDALIVVDCDDVDPGFLPFILGHEGFHCVQDRPMNSGLVPMYNNGVIYNAGVYALSDEKHFKRAFKTMERSCDVVSVTMLWEMRQKGYYTSLFNELAANPHLEQIVKFVSDAGDWAKEQPGKTQEWVLNNCLFYGNVAGMMCAKYNDYLESAAKRTFKDTSRHVKFSSSPSLPTAEGIELAHYSLLSDRFMPDAPMISRNVSAIESWAYEKAAEKKKAWMERVEKALRTADSLRSGAQQLAVR